MHPYKMFLDRIYGSSHCFLTPVYQRHYEWDLVNWERLWKTLINGYYGKDLPEYSFFLGTMIFHQKSDLDVIDKMVFEIIDGQQRIVTVALLLAAMRTKYQEEKDKNRLNEVLLKDISKYESNVENSRITLSYRDNQQFNLIVNGMMNRAEKDTPLYRCYDYFVNILKDWQQPLNFHPFLDLVLKKYFTIVIKLDPNEKAGPIFETVNAYAEPLDLVDRIRAFIFSWLKPERIDRLYGDCWTVIEKGFKNNSLLLKGIKHFLEMKTGETITFQDEYNVLSSYLRTDDEKIQESNIEFFLFEMLENLPYQKLLDDPQDKSIGLVISHDIRYQLSKLKLLGIDSYYPFLLLCLNRYYDPNSKKLSDEKSLKIILSYIETIFIRRFVCYTSDAALTGWFIELCKKAKDNQLLPLPEIMEQSSEKVLPKDDVFRIKIKREALYSGNSRGICRLILSVIEDQLSNYTPGYSAIGQKLEIEHIMPQSVKDSDYWKGILGQNWDTIHGSWVHTLGNIALIANPPNKWASNAPFPEKCEIYQNCMTALLKTALFKPEAFETKNEDWGLKEIEERASHLAETSIKAWPYFAPPPPPPIIKEKEPGDNLKDFYIINEEGHVEKFNGRVTWKNLLYKTIEMLYRNDPKKFLEVIKGGPLNKHCSKEPKKLGKKEAKLADAELYYKPHTDAETIYKVCTDLKRGMGLSDDQWYLVVESKRMAPDGGFLWRLI